MLHVLGPRSGGTSGAALGQGLGLSEHDECDRAVGPALGSGNSQESGQNRNAKATGLLRLSTSF